jgi:DNA-binding MarR family transcriptional regulator
MTAEPDKLHAEEDTRAPAANYSPRDVALAVRRLGLAAADLHAAYSTQVGMCTAELLALEHLDMAGDLPPSELSRRLHLTSGALTALADRLTDRGHLVRTPHPSDRRMLLLHRTEEAAEELRRHIWPMAMDVMELTGRMSEDELDTVGRFLEGIIAILERHATES